MDFPQEHIGDGVYATWDGYHVWLDCRAQSELTPGPTGTPGIALDPYTLDVLNRFATKCREAKKEIEA